MKLEQQVVSLELAKELKELGYPQESLFYWSVPLIEKAVTKEQEELKKCKTELYYRGNDWGEYFESVSAPTVAELGEVLKGKYPMCIKGETIVAGKWRIDSFEADTEADARAKMLIYLLKNKLITI